MGAFRTMFKPALCPVLESWNGKQTSRFDYNGKVLYCLPGLICTDENFIQKSGAQRVASSEGVALIALDTSPRGLNVEGEADSWDFGLVRFDMPGVSKDVKALVEDDVLDVRGEVEEKNKYEEGVTKYEKSFDLESEFLKLDEIKAEMKNVVEVKVGLMSKGCVLELYAF